MIIKLLFINQRKAIVSNIDKESEKIIALGFCSCRQRTKPGI